MSNFENIYDQNNKIFRTNKSDDKLFLAESGHTELFVL